MPNGRRAKKGATRRYAAFRLNPLSQIAFAPIAPQPLPPAVKSRKSRAPQATAGRGAGGLKPCCSGPQTYHVCCEPPRDLSKLGAASGYSRRRPSIPAAVLARPGRYGQKRPPMYFWLRTYFGSQALTCLRQPSEAYRQFSAPRGTDKIRLPGPPGSAPISAFRLRTSCSGPRGEWVTGTHVRCLSKGWSCHPSPKKRPWVTPDLIWRIS